MKMTLTILMTMEMAIARAVMVPCQIFSHEILLKEPITDHSKIFTLFRNFKTQSFFYS